MHSFFELLCLKHERLIVLMKLLVDSHEHHIVDELNKRNISHTVLTLDVGDFHITEDNGNVIAIWERKTYSDLASSISDNRYKEQKYRLLEEHAQYKGYIIEGACPQGKFRNLQPGAVDSIRLGLICRDNLKLIGSSGISHTVTILQKMLKKFPEYRDMDSVDLVDRHQQALVQSTISSIKKDNFNPETCYLAQLCQLPQVSYSTASSIKDRFSNMSELTNAITTNRTDTLHVISELKVSGRRIGNSVATKVCNYLVPIQKRITTIIKKKYCEEK